MSGTTFPNLLRGNRDIGLMGLRMVDGIPKKLGPDYSYIELPFYKATNDGEEITKAIRNQQVDLVAPCTVAPMGGYKALVCINPEVLRYASAPSMLLIDFKRNPKEHIVIPMQQPVVIPAKFHRDLELPTLDYLARIYLIS